VNNASAEHAHHLNECAQSFWGFHGFLGVSWV
jgi:hypothetical protein